MRTREYRGWWLPMAGVAFLAGALVWAALLVRPRPARDGTDAPVGRETVAPAKTPAARSVTVSPPPKEPGDRIRWTAAPGEGPGLFDAPAARLAVKAGQPRWRGGEVELVATRELPFRLQLIGHFGEGANLSGLFEADGAAGSLIAGSGAELTEFGLAVRGLELEPGPAEGGPPRAVARIWDGRAGQELVLPESVRIKSGIGAALLAPAGYPGEAIELLAGEIVEVDDAEFRVERIGLAPASATLRRLATVEGEADEELFLQVEGGPES